MKAGTVARLAVATLMASAIAGSAAAAVIPEVEPNDTLSTAQDVPPMGTTLEIEGARTFEDPSDDFFSFLVQTLGLLSIVSSSPDASADSVMGLYDPSGALVASNDDTFGSFMSAILYPIGPGMTGRYTVGFSGYNVGLLVCVDSVTQCYDTNDDFLFDTFVPSSGEGGSTGWVYTITIQLPGTTSVIPEPGTLALAVLAVPAFFVGARRRQWRRRSSGAPRR